MNECISARRHFREIRCNATASEGWGEIISECVFLFSCICNFTRYCLNIHIIRHLLFMRYFLNINTIIYGWTWKVYFSTNFFLLLVSLTITFTSVSYLISKLKMLKIVCGHGSTPLYATPTFA